MVIRAAAALAAIFVAGAGLSARAAGTDLEFFVGAGLYAECTADAAAADGAARLARCEGYILGVSDVLQAEAGAGGAPTVCLPQNATVPQMVAAVRGFLEAHAEKRQLAAEDLVREALAAAYPCR
jgi:hypothetical protein